MEITYLPEAWHDLYVMLGSSAAAIVGLLFVAMSLHIEEIKKGDEFDSVAIIHAGRNNTYHLLTILAAAAVVLTPQSTVLMGAELAGLNLFGLRLPIGFTYRHFNREISVDHRRGFPMDTILTIAAGYLLGAVGGVGLMAHAEWGIYLVTASCVLIIVRSVLTAWGLLFGRAQARSTAPARRRVGSKPAGGR